MKWQVVAGSLKRTQGLGWKTTKGGCVSLGFLGCPKAPFLSQSCVKENQRQTEVRGKADFIQDCCNRIERDSIPNTTGTTGD